MRDRPRGRCIHFIKYLGMKGSEPCDPDPLLIEDPELGIHDLYAFKSQTSRNGGLNLHRDLLVAAF